jgi:hypothetical protein
MRNCALLAILLCAASASAAISQQLTGDQLKTFDATARSICESVKEARGRKSEAQLQGDVQAKVGGLLGKVVDVGGGAKGAISREEFEGLSQEATATALQADRDCRERVFNKLVDKLSAPAQLQYTPRSPHQSPGVPQQSRAERCCIYRLGWCKPWGLEPGRNARTVTYSELNTLCYCQGWPGTTQDCP